MNVPRHIGVILDGNRRFANKLSESLTKLLLARAPEANDKSLRCKDVQNPSLALTMSQNRGAT